MRGRARREVAHQTQHQRLVALDEDAEGRRLPAEDTRDQVLIGLLLPRCRHPRGHATLSGYYRRTPELLRSPDVGGARRGLSLKSPLCSAARSFGPSRPTRSRARGPALSTFLLRVQDIQPMRSFRPIAVLVAGEPIDRVRSTHGGYADIIRRAAGEGTGDWIDVNFRDRGNPSGAGDARRSHCDRILPA